MRSTWLPRLLRCASATRVVSMQSAYCSDIFSMSRRCYDVDPSRFADVPSPVPSVQHEGSKTFPADENENPTIRPPEVRVSPKGKFAKVGHAVRMTLAQRQTSAAKNMRRHMGNKKQKPQLRKQLTAPGPMNRGTVSGSSLL